MSDEHSISRSDSTRTEEDEESEETDDERSEAETRRELEKSEIGRAIVRINDERRRER